MLLSIEPQNDLRHVLYGAYKYYKQDERER